MGETKKGLFEQALELDYITAQPEQPKEDKQQEAPQGFILPPTPERYSVHKQYLVQPSTSEVLKKAAKEYGISENKLVNELFKQFLAGKLSTSDNIN